MAGKTSAVFFPFDLFGSGGCGAGAQLLADASQEMLADNRREKIATSARAYAGKVRCHEFSFETLAAYQEWRHQARLAARRVLDQGDFLLWVAGNHLGVLPVYEELGRRQHTPSKRTLVMQLDAHLDIYNLSDCTSELSHGNFLLHAETSLPDIINVGHRELLLRPEYVGKHYRHTVSAAELAIDPARSLDMVRAACAEAGHVFLDLDCDVFDSAFFPAQAHPVPFGLAPQLLLRLLDAVWSERFIGLAISEFDPSRDSADRSLATLMWLIEYVLLRRHEKR
jgi:arginase family enzyme